MNRIELKTVNEIVSYYGIPKTTLRSWIYTQKIECVRFGGVVRFTKNQVKSILRHWNKKIGAV